MEWVVVHVGLLLFLAGLVRAAIAPRWLRLRRLWLPGLGLATAAVGTVLPARERTVSRIDSLLDRALPTFEFSELHAATIGAGCGRGFEALLAVTAAEIRGFRALTWIRRLGRSGPESILNAPPDRPLLAVATGTTFRELARQPGREIVIATVLTPPSGAAPPSGGLDDFRTHQPPGRAKAALSFRFAPVGDARCRITTETRVHAADPGTRRAFAAYWRLIYPGSALIRRMWLRAIERRAMQSTP